MIKNKYFANKMKCDFIKLPNSNEILRITLSTKLSVIILTSDITMPYVLNELNLSIWKPVAKAATLTF